MRPTTLLLAAALTIALPAAAQTADPGAAATPASVSDTPPPPPAETHAPPTPSGQGAPNAAAASSTAAGESNETSVAAQPSQTAAEPIASEPEGAAPAPAEPSSPPAPLVVTAQIDPELALRLSLLEKAMVAQTDGQSAIYSETSRLLMFFGSACVGMGLVAMVAAVFLMNRTLASVSAITAQVAHAQPIHALPAATSAALIPAGSTTPNGFEKVQASGQRFQNRMTSLEQRLEELEHLAGNSSTPASSPAAPAEPEPVAAEICPEPARPKVPVSAILVRKSETLMNLGKLDEAMVALDEAATHDGDLTEVHLARGRVLEKLGRLGDALQSYDLAVTSDGTNAAALLMKAGVLNRQERFEEALSCYERALALHRANN